MKNQIKQFCQGIYDSMSDNASFIQKYTLDALYDVVYHAFLSLILKLSTLILGIIACILAAWQFPLKFSTLFWVWVTIWLCWIVSDEDLKKLVKLIKDIEK